MALTHAFVYPSGCTLFLALRADIASLNDQRHIGQLVTDHGEISAPLTAAVTCAGITTVGDLRIDSAETTVFYRTEARGSGQSWQLAYWLAPLPAEDFTFTIAAPSIHLPESRTVLAAYELHRAAQQAKQLWPLNREQDPYQGLT